MDFKKAFGMAFKQLRLAKGFTQDNFNEITDRALISKIENGEKQPTVYMLNRYAKFMGAHPLTVMTQAYLNENPELTVNDLLKLVKNELPAKEKLD